MELRDWLASSAVFGEGCVLVGGRRRRMRDAGVPSGAASRAFDGRPNVAVAALEAAEARVTEGRGPRHQPPQALRARAPPATAATSTGLLVCVQCCASTNAIAVPVTCTASKRTADAASAEPAIRPLAEEPSSPSLSLSPGTANRALVVSPRARVVNLKRNVSASVRSQSRAALADVSAECTLFWRQRCAHRGVVARRTS